MRIQHLVKVWFGLGCVLAGLALSDDALAVNRVRFCAGFVNNYWDSLSGQDRLVEDFPLANKHWAVVEHNGATLYSDYMTNNCTAFMPITAGTYKFFVTSAVRVAAGKYVWVYWDDAEDWSWTSLETNIAQNPTADTTFPVTFGGTEIFHASMVASLINPAALAPGTYKVFAAQNCPGSLSCFCPGSNPSCTNGDAVYLGDIDQTGPDAFSKTVIGHELGHYAQALSFGSWNYSYSQNATQSLCKCDHVTDPLDRAHCLQSREQTGGARNEGWGHAFAALLYNVGTDATAPFAYYKNFLNPGASQPIVPPVSADALTIYHWMESYCLSTNAGIELDYMGFFYYLQTKTANAYSFANMNTLFSQECGGTCNSADVVSWTTLQGAASASFGAGSAKANHLNTAADSFGVNH